MGSKVRVRMTHLPACLGQEKQRPRWDPKWRCRGRDAPPPEGSDPRAPAGTWEPRTKPFHWYHVSPLSLPPGVRQDDAVVKADSETDTEGEQRLIRPSQRVIKRRLSHYRGPKSWRSWMREEPQKCEIDERAIFLGIIIKLNSIWYIFKNLLDTR